MIIAISSTGTELTSALDQRFGRAQYILFVNTDNQQFDVYDNNVNLSASQGAGISTAQYVVDKGANTVITGNFGPKAYKVLQAGNINMYSCNQMSVKEALDAFLQNKLSPFVL